VPYSVSKANGTRTLNATRVLNAHPVILSKKALSLGERHFYVSSRRGLAAVLADVIGDMFDGIDPDAVDGILTVLTEAIE